MGGLSKFPLRFAFQFGHSEQLWACPGKIEASFDSASLLPVLVYSKQL